MLPAFFTALATEGLGLLANVGLAKGREWLSDKTGVDLSKPQLDSADFVALQNYQFKHEEELLKIAQNSEVLRQNLSKMYLEDVQSARTMQGAALASDSKFAKNFVYVFAICWSLFAVAYMMIITLADIPEPNMRYADTVLGFLLGTIIAQILGFFFGSSHSSHAKNETIKAIVKGEIR